MSPLEKHSNNTQLLRHRSRRPKSRNRIIDEIGCPVPENHVVVANHPWLRIQVACPPAQALLYPCSVREIPPHLSSLGLH